jgi:GNAT superfamily N-acetyltransferase
MQEKPRSEAPPAADAFAAGGEAVTVRVLETRDISAGLELCRIAGWNQEEADWRLLLDLGPGGCFAAVHNGRVVGTVTTMQGGGGVSWIAMVLVHPSMRRRGVGNLLFRRALEALGKSPCVRLLATPDGIGLYRAHGFLEEETYTLMTRPASPAPSADAAPAQVSPVRDGDLPGLIAFDAEVNGPGREPLLRGILSLAPEYAGTTRNTLGEITGFYFGRSGKNYSALGPLAACDIDTAASMALTFLHSCAGNAAGILVPDIPEWKARLMALGFERRRELVLMYRGEKISHSARGRYAAAGAEYGF